MTVMDLREKTDPTIDPGTVNDDPDVPDETPEPRPGIDDEPDEGDSEQT